MTEKQLKQSVKQQIDNLSDRRLQSAADFLRYLNDLDSDEATDEIMRIPGAMASIEEGLEDIAEGRTTPLRKLSRKYKHV